MYDWLMSSWQSIDIETSGDLPCRRTTHHRSTGYFWERDIPDVHLLQWDYNGGAEDDEEVRRVLQGLQSGDHLTITATAPSNPAWLEHVILLRVELFYSCV